MIAKHAMVPHLISELNLLYYINLFNEVGYSLLKRKANILQVQSHVQLIYHLRVIVTVGITVLISN